MLGETISAEREWFHPRTVPNSAHWIRFVFGKMPVGKIASTNLSCAKRLVFDVACRYLFVKMQAVTQADGAGSQGTK